MLPVLYSFRRCPYAMRARLALDASGQACELREIALRNKPAAMLSASPKGTVPVLIDIDGAVIDESIDIMVWSLARNDPEQWLGESATRAEMRALVAHVDGHFKHHLDRYKYPVRYPDADAAVSRDAASRDLHDLETRLSRTPWLFGARATLADFAIAPFVRQFGNVDPRWYADQPWPALRDWLARIVESSRFQRIMRPVEPWVPGTAGIAFPFRD